MTGRTESFSTITAPFAGQDELGGDRVYQRQLSKGFGWLGFEAAIETEFRKDWAADAVTTLRLSLIAAIVLSAGITLLDQYTQSSDLSGTAVPLRNFVVRPILIAALGCTFIRFMRPALPAIAVAIGLSIGAMNVMLALAEPSYLLGAPILVVALTTLAVYVLLGLRFWPAFFTNGAILLMYATAAVAWPETPLANPYAALILVWAAFAGAVAAYRIEYVRRANFLRRRALEESATADSLTHVANHAALSRYLGQAWCQCQLGTIPLGLMQIDLDDFREFSDIYGAHARDECLVEVAKALRFARKRPLDFLARSGYDRFTIVLPGVEADYLRTLAEDARKAIEALGIAHCASRASRAVTVSIGAVRVFPGAPEQTIEGTLELASRALDSAKAAGCNSVRLALEQAPDAYEPKPAVELFGPAKLSLVKG